MDIEKDINEFHRTTFPNATLNAVLFKLNEELVEAMMALVKGDYQHLLEELADVFVVSTALAARKDLFEDNVSMTRVIRDKMAVNKARKWGKEDPVTGDRKRVK